MKDAGDVFRSRLHPYTWDILDTWVESAFELAARVRRRRDGKTFIAKYNMIDKELTLIPEGWLKGR